MDIHNAHSYKLLHPICQGGMAEIWQAETPMHQLMAVKILLPMYCSFSDVVNRFRAEAEVMARLQHPNIRRVYGYDESTGQPRILMEYLDGDDLAKRMKRGERFSQEQLCKWWNQLADALYFTHRHGVVHRDIKPSNIFITTEGDVKLLDFGIAKINDSSNVHTQTGATLGTLMYMSPEQVRDSKYIDYKTDLYSLAVTFVHLLSGFPPYDTTTTDDFEIRSHIVNQPLNMKGVPPAWRAFLLPYLSKKPEDRSQLVKFGNIPTGTHTSIHPRKPKAWPWIVAVCLVALTAALTVILLNKNNKHIPEENTTIIDPTIDEYEPLTIGTQVWMTKNMRNRHDSEGNLLKEGTDYYNYNSESEEYGLLYSWDAAMKVCPEGWHLPSDQEWQQLKMYVSSQNRYVYDGDIKKIAKSLASTTDWKWDDHEGTVGNFPQTNNSTGFSALPANCYDPRKPDATTNPKERADFWTSTPNYNNEGAIYYYLCSNSSSLSQSHFYKKAGLSVRCVKD